jgi:hypothetical protein
MARKAIEQKLADKGFNIGVFRGVSSADCSPLEVLGSLLHLLEELQIQCRYTHAAEFIVSPEMRPFSHTFWSIYIFKSRFSRAFEKGKFMPALRRGREQT